MYLFLIDCFHRLYYFQIFSLLVTMAVAGPLYYTGYLANVNPGASLGLIGYAPAAAPGLIGGYASSGRYVANSGGVVHVAKR